MPGKPTCFCGKYHHIISVEDTAYTAELASISEELAATFKSYHRAIVTNVENLQSIGDKLQNICTNTCSLLDLEGLDEDVSICLERITEHLQKWKDDMESIDLDAIVPLYTIIGVTEENAKLFLECKAGTMWQNYNETEKQLHPYFHERALAFKELLKDRQAQVKRRIQSRKVRLQGNMVRVPFGNGFLEFDDSLM